MAHSPEIKAAVIFDLVQGMSCDKAAKKHGVGKATVVEWNRSIKTDQDEGESDQNRPTGFLPVTPDQPLSEQGRREKFNSALEEFLLSAIQLGLSLAQATADPEFIQRDPSGANELAKTVFERADRLVRFVSE